MKTKQKKSNLKKFLKPFAIGTIAVITLLNSAVIIAHWRYDSEHDNTQITDLIIMSVENLNRPATIEPITGNVYLTTAKLVLPSENSNVGQVQYSFSPSDGDFKPEVHISRRMDVLLAENKLKIAANKSLKDVFDEVPRLQACSRGIRIAYEQSEGGTSAGSKTLKNGETVYFYTEDACSNPDLLNYAKDIESY